MDIPNSKNLLFRQQFIIGPRYVDSFESWKKHEITKSIIITSHPDLNISQLSKYDKKLTLIGYLIDPKKPDDDNDKILYSLILEKTDINGLVKSTFGLCGSWILIYVQDRNVFIFNDCTGTRSLFYTEVDKNKYLWCGSQPRLIADLLEFKEDREAISFILSQKSKTHNYWWPGDTSPFREIKRLLPNNYLELIKGKIYRYWPDRNLKNLPKNEAIDKISIRLKAIMQSAAKRFDLALALSSGIDSRVMLAASKDIKEKICIYNGKRPEMSKKHPDILVPRRLTKKLKLKYNYIPQTIAIDAEFSKTCEMNAPYPTMEIVPGLEAEYKYFKQQKVGTTGNILEIARCFYHYEKGVSAGYKPSGKLLATHAKLADEDFAITAFESWLKSVVNVFNLNIYDLYGWELRHGSWFSNNCLIMNTSWKDIFFPFNCRDLIIDFLSVSDIYRRPPDYPFFKELIKNMWPETLQEPINPIYKPGTIHKIKTKIKRILQ